MYIFSSLAEREDIYALIVEIVRKTLFLYGFVWSYLVEFRCSP